MLFVAIVFIIRAQKWQFAKRRRALYGLVAIDEIYLVGALYFAFSWLASTGLLTMEPFFEFDTLYFVTLSVTLGFMMLYFADICMGRVRHPLLIFPIPIVMAIIFLFVNPATGCMFNYDGGEYHRGPLLILNYIVWFSYMGAMVVMVYRARISLGAKTFFGLLLFFAYEFGLQIYQFFVVDFYIGGVAFTTGLLYLVISPLFLEPGHDELTGLFNQRGFLNTVPELLRFDTETEYCMVAVDINNFRNVNERFVFQTGNNVLSYVGKYLNRLYPDTDTLARFSADKFYICCPRDKVVLSLPNIPIEECAPEVREPYLISLHQGIYPIEDRNADVSLLCDRATFALQQVKGDYQRTYAFFDANAQERLRYRSHILQEMRNALEHRKFSVFLQPIMDIQTGTITAAEALIRWEDDTYGMISPADFIPLFEDNGFISELDLFVCREVCEHVARWKNEGRNVVPVSVNVSRADLLTPGFLDDFSSTVTAYGVSSEDIRMEITESVLVRSEEIKRQLESVQRMGYKILMDDFGSGYSNFNTFATMPVDILKADMGFMANLEHSERGQSVFSSIVEMAHRLSIPIVAEGVETKDQVESLRAMGIRFVQGYYYSRPVPAAEFATMFDQNATMLDQNA
ncbi:MAG: EAL domain-containing protein [Eggerthellaceae bacterium]|nr:EAL domain-containing protein [Eggerthellaceae bacterium]